MLQTLRKDLVYKEDTMIKKIKLYLQLDCIIFTAMTVVLNLFYILTGLYKEITVSYFELTFQYLTVTTIMTVLFFIFDKILNSDNAIVAHLVSIAIVVGTVFILGGGIFKWFNIMSLWSLAVLGIIFVVYSTVYFLTFYRNVSETQKINDMLKEAREENNE